MGRQQGLLQGPLLPGESNQFHDTKFRRVMNAIPSADSIRSGLLLGACYQPTFSSEHFPTPYLLILIGAGDDMDDLYVRALVLSLLLLLLELQPELLLLLHVTPQGLVDQLDRLLAPWAVPRAAHGPWAAEQPPVLTVVPRGHSGHSGFGLGVTWSADC